MQRKTSRATDRQAAVSETTTVTAGGQATVYETTAAEERPVAVKPHPLPALRPGWSRPRPEHIPAPTYAPAILALSIVFILWGIITSMLITAIGLVLLFIALVGWIGELRHGD